MITPLGSLIGLIVVTGILVASMSLETHMENSKRTEFCLSCHAMETHGMSLYVDDKEYIPAVHFQNHRIPKDQACFTCHTSYTMYGDYAAKLRGLRHLYYQYIAGIPDTIRLYEPYNNRECLHCHDGARSFEQQPIHSSTPGLLDSIKTNKMSCLSGGCHDIAHDVSGLKKASFWKPAAPNYCPEWLKDSISTAKLLNSDTHVFVPTHGVKFVR